MKRTIWIMFCSLHETSTEPTPLFMRMFAKDTQIDYCEAFTCSEMPSEDWPRPKFTGTLESTYPIYFLYTRYIPGILIYPSWFDVPEKLDPRDLREHSIFLMCCRIFKYFEYITGFKFWYLTWQQNRDGFNGRYRIIDLMEHRVYGIYAQQAIDTYYLFYGGLTWAQTHTRNCVCFVRHVVCVCATCLFKAL